MKKIFLLLFSVSCITVSFAQQETSAQETARTYMRAADWDNAILVLNRALQQDPKNMELQKDLVLAYYYKRDYARAMEKIQPMLDDNNADEVVYQLGGNVYKALEEVKEADKMYKKAMKKFPKSEH